MIAPCDKYEARYTVFFILPKRPLLYGNTINATTMPVVHAHAKAIHTAKLADYATYEAAKHAVMKFICTAIDKT